MGIYIDWKGGDARLVLVRCTACNARLLRMTPGPRGPREMQCFGTFLAGSDRMACAECGAITTIPRWVVAGARTPSALHPEHDVGAAARVVLEAPDRPEGMRR